MKLKKINDVLGILGFVMLVGFLTDENNIILDCTFPGIPQPAVLAQQIKAQPGIVEHGLFLNLATDVVWATPTGVETVSRR